LVPSPFIFYACGRGVMYRVVTWICSR
jgi:hypothetical protein